MQGTYGCLQKTFTSIKKDSTLINWDILFMCKSKENTILARATDSELTEVSPNSVTVS